MRRHIAKAASHYFKQWYRGKLVHFMRLVPRGPAYLYCLEWLQIQQLGMEEWLAIDGDATLLVNYELNENSLVFDLGGFAGEWTEHISNRYRCYVFTFEPIPEFAENITKKFSANQKIKVYAFGLAGATRVAPLVVDSADPETSSLLGQGASIDVKLVKALDFLQQQGIPYIDLMKINIEGGEYELLRHLIKSRWIKNIGNIQVQFHNIFPEAGKLMVQLQNDLCKTHYLTYQYPLIWENWRLRR